MSKSSGTELKVGVRRRGMANSRSGVKLRSKNRGPTWRQEKGRKWVRGGPGAEGGSG